MRSKLQNKYKMMDCSEDIESDEKSSESSDSDSSDMSDDEENVVNREENQKKIVLLQQSVSLYYRSYNSTLTSELLYRMFKNASIVTSFTL